MWVLLAVTGALYWILWVVPIAAAGGHLLWLGIVCAAQGLTSGPSTLSTSNYAYVRPARVRQTRVGSASRWLSPTIFCFIMMAQRRGRLRHYS